LHINGNENTDSHINDNKGSNNGTPKAELQVVEHKAPKFEYIKETCGNKAILRGSENELEAPEMLGDKDVCGNKIELEAPTPKRCNNKVELDAPTSPNAHDSNPNEEGTGKGAPKDSAANANHDSPDMKVSTWADGPAHTCKMSERIDGPIDAFCHDLSSDSTIRTIYGSVFKPASPSEGGNVPAPNGNHGTTKCYELSENAPNTSLYTGGDRAPECGRPTPPNMDGYSNEHGESTLGSISNVTRDGYNIMRNETMADTTDDTPPVIPSKSTGVGGEGTGVGAESQNTWSHNAGVMGNDTSKGHDTNDEYEYDQE
jgi:hypothetical protein